MLLQELLVDGVMLFGANTPTNTTKAKLVTWRKIAEQISALGVVNRTAEEARLKWKGLRKEVIEKDADIKVTGGGKGKERHIPFEEMIRAVIGERSNLYSGIEGM